MESNVEFLQKTKIELLLSFGSPISKYVFKDNEIAIW